MQNGTYDNGGAGAGISVLFVDDDPDLLGVATEFLSAFPELRIHTERSADAGLAFLRGGHVDAIVSDYEMPEKDGIVFLQELRLKGDLTPFIIFTGKGRELIAMQALNYGADFYLQKGGDAKAQFAELRNMIEKAVERRRAVDEAKALAERVEHQAQILDEILSSIPDPVLIIDADGRITYANLAGAKILGFSRMAVLGRHIRELRLPEDTESTLRAAAGRVLATGEKTSADISWAEGNGVKRYRCSLSPLHATTGKINAVDIIFRDITEESRIAAELDQCQTRVSGLLEGRNQRLD